jgi:hypothetical protein
LTVSARKAIIFWLKLVGAMSHSLVYYEVRLSSQRYSFMFRYVVLKDCEGQTISQQCGCRLALSTLEKPFKGLSCIAEEDVLSLEHADNLNAAGDSPDMKAMTKFGVNWARPTRGNDQDGGKVTNWARNRTSMPGNNVQAVLIR